MRRIDVIKNRRKTQPVAAVDLSRLSWLELKAMAKKAGISSYRKNREALENEIQA